MNLRGIFIEYFITGAAALMWIYLLIDNTGIVEEIKATNSKLLVSTIIVSLIYIIGIVVDFIGKQYMNLIRLSLQWNSHFEKLKKGYEADINPAKLFHFNKDLGQQYEIRSSRDRIVRGAAINVLFSVFSILISVALTEIAFNLVIIIGILLFVLLTIIWIRFQMLSNEFLRDSSKLIKEEKYK